jgi:hypothetical protein
MSSDPQLPAVFVRSDALGLGLTRNQVEHRLSSGVWVALRRGVFCLRSTLDDTEPARRCLLHAEAARLARPAADLVDSHLTAAARWELPLPLGAEPRATLTDGRTTRTPHADANTVIQVATFWPGDVHARQGHPTTSPARTVADCLRHYAAETSVPIADAAIHRDLAAGRAITRVLDRQANWPYAARAAHSLPLVDGRRESWLESFSAVSLWRVGVDLGEPQVEIFDVDGTFIARVDFLWLDQATVGEADGAGKYSIGEWADLGQATSGELADARIEAGRRIVLREKAREDALRDAGLEVVRGNAAQLLRSSRVVAGRIERARRRGDLARFTGRTRSTGAN